MDQVHYKQKASGANKKWAETAYTPCNYTRDSDPSYFKHRIQIIWIIWIHLGKGK